MTITWPTSATTICHGADRTLGNAVGPDALDIVRTPGLHRRAPVDGPGPTYEASGNDEMTIAFGVIARYATPALAAASAFTLNLQAATGDLGLGSIGTLKGAGMTRCEVRQRGLTVRVNYAFSGHFEEAAV